MCPFSNLLLCCVVMQWDTLTRTQAPCFLDLPATRIVSHTNFCVSKFPEPQLFSYRHIKLMKIDTNVILPLMYGIQGRSNSSYRHRCLTPSTIQRTSWDLTTLCAYIFTSKMSLWLFFVLWPSCNVSMGPFPCSFWSCLWPLGVPLGEQEGGWRSFLFPAIAIPGQGQWSYLWPSAVFPGHYRRGDNH